MLYEIVTIDEYMTRLLAGRINEDITYHITEYYAADTNVRNITLKCTWELNQDRSWENLNQHVWGDFKLVDYYTKFDYVFEGKYLNLPGKVEFSANFKTDIKANRIENAKVLFTGETDLTVSNLISEGDYINRMREYLPWYEKDDPVFLEILKAYDYEFRRQENDRRIIERNQFVNSMVETLDIWERDFGITRLDGLNHKQRREQIRANWIAQFGQLTTAKLKWICEGFTGAGCELATDLNTNILTIRFTDMYGAPDNIEGLMILLDKIMPAHWGFVYEARYIIWNDLTTTSWYETRVKTWEEVRTWEEKIKQNNWIS